MKRALFWFLSLFILSLSFFYYLKDENGPMSQDKEYHNANTNLKENIKVEAPKEVPHKGNTAGLQDNKDVSMTSTDIVFLINKFYELGEFNNSKQSLLSMSKTSKQDIVHFLEDKIKSNNEFTFSLRALDILQLLFEDDSSLVTGETLDNIHKLFSKNNPLLTRGGVRVLSSINSTQSLELLIEEIDQEDASISTEVLNIISDKSEKHEEFFKNKRVDTKIISCLEHFQTNEQGTLELKIAGVRALTKITGNDSFNYLTQQLVLKNVNLSIKNEIAKALPKWNKAGIGSLQKYLNYLKSLKKEPDSTMDADRANGIIITENSLSILQK